MNRQSISRISVVLGLIVGVGALWVAAAPVGASGDLITGGNYYIYDVSGDGDYIGCETLACQNPTSLTYTWCSSVLDEFGQGMLCGGDAILVIHDDGSSNGVAGWTWPAVCNDDPPGADPRCRSLYDATISW